MPLQFIFGPSGSGKSTYLYKYIMEEALQNPHQQYLVIVPNQFTLETQQKMVSLHPRHSLLNIDVLSFERLAYRVQEELGGSLPLLEEEGKNFVLRKIAEEKEEQLSLLQGKLKKMGYITELKSLLSEFMQYGIGPEELRGLLKQEKKEGMFYQKLSDILVMYEGFLKEIEDSYMVTEELLDVLIERSHESKRLKESVLAFDGFTGFTPVQNRALESFLKIAKKMMITISLGEGVNPYKNMRNPNQLFYLSKKTVRQLLEMAEARSILKHPDIFLRGAEEKRFQNRKDLAFLEHHLFRGREVQQDRPTQIRLFRLKHPKEECHWVAETIRGLVRKEGYRYKEIAVVLGDMTSYQEYLKEAFALYDIPGFFDQKRNILFHSYIEHIRSVLELQWKGFQRDSVFRYLRSDFSPLEKEEVDALENYVLGLGIKGKKAWYAPWDKGLGKMEVAEIQRISGFRDKFLEGIDPIREVFQKGKKTVFDMTKALYRYMESQNHQRKLEEREVQFQEMGRLDLAKEYGQIYPLFLDLLDKLVSLLGREQVSMEEYARLMDAGLEEASMGLIPPTQDEVLVGDLQRTRIEEAPIVFLVGAGDNHLPGNLFQQGLLGETDREMFERAGLELAPGGKEEIYRQKFYLYLQLTKAKEKLFLSYSRSQMDGGGLRPSYLIGEIQRMFPAISVETREESVLKREWSKESGFDYLTQKWHEGEEDNCFRELFCWMSTHFLKDETEDFVKALCYHYFEKELRIEDVETLFPKHQKKSVTRMERFVRCQFAHFLTYGLRLKEREEYEFQKVDLGNVCHNALERFGNKIGQERNWTEISEEERERWLEESVEEAVEEYGNDILKSSSRNRYIGVRVKRLLKWSVWALTKQLQADGFHPVWQEKDFGYGKIDRIDYLEARDKVFLKVVDYKTGKKEFNLGDFFQGLQLQLMVYMKEAMSLGWEQWKNKEVVPGGMYYYKVKEPWISKEAGEEGKEFLKELKLDGLLSLEKEVLEGLNQGLAEEIMQVKWNRGGELSAKSKVVTPEEFQLLLEYVDKKEEEIQSRIQKGSVQVAPIRKQGKETGCDYCNYQGICKFSEKLRGYHYQEMKSYTKEEALTAIKEALEEEGKQNEMDQGSTKSH